MSNIPLHPDQLELGVLTYACPNLEKLNPLLMSGGSDIFYRLYELSRLALSWIAIALLDTFFPLSQANIFRSLTIYH